MPFKLQLGRDNLYERMHGLPKHTKEQMKIIADNYKNKVDHREFLPNSVINSPMKKMHSNSFRTKCLGLSKIRSMTSKSEASHRGLQSTRRESHLSSGQKESEQPNSAQVKTEDKKQLSVMSVDQEAMMQELYTMAPCMTE